MEVERRRFSRYPFVAEVHIEEILSRTEFVGRTRNISFGGCFIDVDDPLRAGTPVRITISNDGTTFKALGNVVVALANFGMRLAFESFGAEQETVLRAWVESAKQKSGCQH